ncbi:MAG: DUF29 domain-containing protein [Pseudomonadota bacterium]|nr:DUF29 domain-containing protein [Pseudomonadota bacterium]
MASLYETDFHAWAEDQAAKLYRLANELVNSELDLANLAEEVESMAGSDRRELAVRLELILVHLLKLAYCFYVGPRQQWINSVQAQRGSIRRMLKQSPSLRRLMPEYLVDAYATALEKARTETIDLTMDEPPVECPFDLDTQVLSREFIPEPPVRFDA